MPRQLNKRMDVGELVEGDPTSAANIISTPKGAWYASNHGKDIDAGIAFLRQTNGDTAMIAFVTAHPNMCFVPQVSTTPALAQEPKIA